MQELGNGLSQMETHDPEESSLFETMVRVEHDLSDVIAALVLLGVAVQAVFPLLRPWRTLRERAYRLLQMHSRLVVFNVNTTRCHGSGAD